MSSDSLILCKDKNRIYTNDIEVFGVSEFSKLFIYVIGIYKSTKYTIKKMFKHNYLFVRI